MKKIIIAIVSLILLLVVGVAVYFGMNKAKTPKPSGITSGATFRAKAEMDADTVFYLDDEKIPLSAPPAENSELQDIANEATDIINEIRKEAGVAPLTYDPNLKAVSDVRSEECSESFSHDRPNGNAWNTVNSKIQGGENLAFGFDSAQDAVDAWMESPTHAQNITYPDFTRAAISIHQSDDGTCYWAHEFGY